MRDVDLNYEAECILYHAMNNCVREKKIKDQVQLTRPYMEQDVGLAHLHAIQELKPQRRTLTAGIEDD